VNRRLAPAAVKDLVRRGYNEVAKAYAAQRDTTPNLPYLERFMEGLPASGKILDLGCGAGIVSNLLAARGFDITGVDISDKQIELARFRVPEAQFLVADMQGLTEGQFAVDGIVSLYAIFHLPRETHAHLFQVLRTFLTSNGMLLVTMGEEAWEGFEEGFLGRRMYWSHYGRNENRALIEAAGFEVLLDEIDSSADERHQIVPAKAR
jgi:SAM-dependent methyltransferase